MNVFELADPEALALRFHPWHGSVTDPSLRHHDLRRQPELIRTALEDWIPFEHHAAANTFYTLVEWLNGPDSSLETSDCAFNGPAANPTPAVHKAQMCSGRLMILFRDLTQNTAQQPVHALSQALARALSSEDVGFECGACGVTTVPTRFTNAPGSADQQLGPQLMLSLWAWGDDEADTMKNLDRTLVGVSRALRRVGG